MSVDQRISHVEALARAVRRHVLCMTHQAKASHIGSCLSVADILAVLYGAVLHVDPRALDDPNRDRLILSKGHAAAALYAVLAERGFISVSTLEHFCENRSMLLGHASHQIPGVEISTGSLGHGLPIALGMAMALKKQRSPARVFCVMSDGECQEGSVWEAVAFAGYAQLDNVVVLIDVNGWQGLGRLKDILDLDAFPRQGMRKKWEAFGWATKQLDGNDCGELLRNLEAVPISIGSPTVLICYTVKGQGVSFMQDRLEWHYRSPSAEELARALGEL
jgi:transketolase